MIYRLAWVIEAFSIIIYIHRLYGKKIKLDIETIVFFLVALGILEVCWQLQINNIITVCIYLFLTLYCARKFQDTIKGAIITVVSMIVIISILQFLFVLPLACIANSNQGVRMVATNGFVAAFGVWILPNLKIHKLRTLLRKRDNLILSILLVVLSIVFILLFEDKVWGQIHMEIFVLVMPVLAFLVILLNRWNVMQEEKEYIEKELNITQTMQEKYDDLLTAVRLREHGFKNQLTALLALKYTNKSYEELVKEQEHYWGKIRTSNKFNRLLYLGDSVISGFLYEKLSEAETQGIEVIYEIKGCITQCSISHYHVIEMLGILIDNAVEAQMNLGVQKQLKVLFREIEDGYWFKILNPFPYTSYSVIESWFQKGSSSKGTDRGLGLYQLKELCQEHRASIICRNIETEKNWIEFTLEIKKADEP